MQKTKVWVLGWEDPLEKNTHSSILAWKIPGTKEPGGLQSMGLQRVGTQLGNFHFHSVQFSCSVMSDCLWLHGLQHARPPCPSWTPKAYSDSCPSSQWCHPTISSSVIPFSSCLQSFPASGSFPMSQFFTSGGQSVGVSASALVLPVNIQDWFPLGWTGWIFCCPRDSQESSPTPQFKSINSSSLSFLYSPTFTSVHDYWKNHSFDKTDLCWQSNVSFLNMLSKLVITSLPRSKCPLISWLQSPSAVILEPPKIKSVTVSTVSPSTCHEVMGPDAMILVFSMLSFKPTFSLSSFTFLKRFFSWHIIIKILKTTREKRLTYF